MNRSRFNATQRSRILAAAVNVFAENGWKGATTRKLGQAAGVNSALIYYYFENKHTLFLEAIQWVIRGFLEQLQCAQPVFTGARHRIQFLVDGLFDYYTAHPERLRLMAVAMVLHTELFSQALGALLPQAALTPLTVLNEGMTRRELRSMHPLEAWWIIMGVCIFHLQGRKIARHLRVPGMSRLPAGPAASRERIIEFLEHSMALVPVSITHHKKRERI